MEIGKSEVLIQFLLIFRRSGDVLFFVYARRFRGYTATVTLSNIFFARKAQCAYHWREVQEPWNPGRSLAHFTASEILVCSVFIVLSYCFSPQRTESWETVKFGALDNCNFLMKKKPTKVCMSFRNYVATITMRLKHKWINGPKVFHT